VERAPRPISHFGFGNFSRGSRRHWIPRSNALRDKCSNIGCEDLGREMGQLPRDSLVREKWEIITCRRCPRRTLKNMDQAQIYERLSPIKWEERSTHHDRVFWRCSLGSQVLTSATVMDKKRNLNLFRSHSQSHPDGLDPQVNIGSLMWCWGKKISCWGRVSIKWWCLEFDRKTAPWNLFSFFPIFFREMGAKVCGGCRF